MAKVNEQKANAAQAYFKFNPNLKTVFITSCLTGFADKNSAVNHAHKLADKDIDIFTRDNDQPIVDMLLSAEATAESNTIPDFKLSQAKRAGDAVDVPFVQIVPPADAPAITAEQYAAAKEGFTALVIIWNAMTAEEKEAGAGVSMSAELDQFHSIITQYEALNGADDPALTISGLKSIIADSEYMGANSAQPDGAPAPTIVVDAPVLTPTQKAAITRAANAAKKLEEKK